MEHAVINREIDPVDGKTNPLRAAPLRVVGVDPELGFAGGETQVLGLTLALVGAGHGADLVCDPAGRLWERARQAGIGCHPLRIRNSIDLAAAIRLRAILGRERYDVVHFHTARAHAMAPFARAIGSARIVTRRMDYRPNRIFAPYLFNRSVDAVVAISRSVADSLVAAGVDRALITTVPSGVDCDRFRPPSAAERGRARAALEIGDDEIAIGAVGMLQPRKGHRYLIEAIAMVSRAASSPAQAAQLRCIIGGAGSIRGELERAAADLGGARQVTLLGRIEDAREILWACDIFAMPSLKEGLGVAMLEAMACGLPSIASGVGGLGEVVEHDLTGILVEPGRPDQIAAAISRLTASKELRQRLGAAARIRAEENFSMASMAARTLALYRATLNRTRSTIA